jgi:cytochrome c-type biogenesis protein CcmH/NrfG
VQKEPMIYAVAGMVFGFVLGYMAANMGDHPEPRAAPPPGVPAGDAEAAPPARLASPARERPSVPDPNEVRALEALAAREKGNVQARVELGNLLMDHGQYEDAARWYREALALAPNSTDVRVDLGACLVSAGKADEALAEFDRALARDPGHKKALFNKGIALMQTGKPKEAVAVWEGLLKRYPDDPQLRGLREQIDQVRATRSRS